MNDDTKQLLIVMVGIVASIYIISTTAASCSTLEIKKTERIEIECIKSGGYMKHGVCLRGQVNDR